MLFTELRFALFFALVFTVAWAVRHNGGRKGWLLLASYAFYAAWDWRFLGLIALSTAVDFAAGLRLARSDGPRRAWLVASLLANLGILGFFKYFNFFVESAGSLLGALGLESGIRTLPIVLPVGISFFTFQSMSYTIDVYRGRMAPTRSFVDFALFVSFFPQLVAGPIVRARTFLPQLTARPSFAAVPVRRCLTLFLVGFVKKACVADHLAVAVDAVFEPAAAFDLASHWLALGLYSLQIYCDFSGYSDMAIGVAGLLGYRLTRNFDFPYLARSVREFWRRWHISLSTWFRDYLYVPLGGNRHGAARTGLHLVAVFLLCGLWHGAAWTFVIWGATHGLLLLVERGRFGDWLARRNPLLQTLYVQLAVTYAWVWFRAVDAGHAVSYSQALFGFGGVADESLSAVWWGVLASLGVIHLLAARLHLTARLAALSPTPFAAAYGALFAFALPWVHTGHRPFIYFQF